MNMPQSERHVLRRKVTHLFPGSSSPDDGKMVQFIILCPDTDSSGSDEAFQIKPFWLPARSASPLFSLYPPVLLPFVASLKNATVDLMVEPPDDAESSLEVEAAFVELSLDEELAGGVSRHKTRS